MSVWKKSIDIKKSCFDKWCKQAGAVKLEVIVYVVEEGWSWRCNLGWV